MNKIKKSWGESLFDGSLIVFFILVCIVMLYPFWNVLMTSFSTEAQFSKSLLMFWPKPFDFTAYRYLFTTDQIPRSFLVSAFVTVAGTFYSMILTTSLAYALSRKYLPGRITLLYLISFTMFFSGGLIPFYLLVRDLGLTNKIWSMILPVGINVWYFVLVKAFFGQIPDSLEESAKIDGANDIYVFWKIMLPLSKPAIATFSLFYAVDYWNQWYNATLFITKKELQPLQTILRKMVVLGNQSAELEAAFRSANDKAYFGLFQEGVKMATVIVATAPILLVYPFVQRYFIKGTMIGAIKE